MLWRLRLIHVQLMRRRHRSVRIQWTETNFAAIDQNVVISILTLTIETVAVLVVIRWHWRHQRHFHVRWHRIRTGRINTVARRICVSAGQIRIVVNIVIMST